MQQRRPSAAKKKKTKKKKNKKNKAKQKRDFGDKTCHGKCNGLGVRRPEF